MGRPQSELSKKHVAHVHTPGMLHGVCTTCKNIKKETTNDLRVTLPLFKPLTIFLGSGK